MKQFLFTACIAACVTFTLYELRIYFIAPFTDPLAERSVQHGDHWDYTGLIHFHTYCTGDATGSYEELGKAANRQHLDFMISTERNNLLALREHREGWVGHTLFLVGAEMTRPEGYLLALNLVKFPFTRFTSTEEVLQSITEQQGLAFTAHPENPRFRWKMKDDPRILGIEIVDLTDQFNAASALSKAAWILDYPFNMPYAYLQMYNRPSDALAKWDAVASKRPYVGIFAPDFHQHANILGDLAIDFPRSEDMMPAGHDHIVINRALAGDLQEDKKEIYKALRNGQLYVAMDSIRDATGFFFTAMQAGKTAWMGSTLAAGQTTEFTVSLPPSDLAGATIIHVYCNGKEIHSVPAQASYKFKATAVGAYRIEVDYNMPAFWGSREVPWVYSNPIYLN